MPDLKSPLSGCRVRLADLAGRCRFLFNESGATAVDFALVLLPFLTVLMAIIESAVVLLAGQVLQTAATDASRQILTGQAQTQGLSLSQFQTGICASLTVMFNCTKINIDVRSFSNFSSVSLPSVTNADGTLTNNYSYQLGNAGDVVVVRVIYQWPIFTSALSFGIVNSASNTNTLVATAAFRNEPY
jgi:Flp pilus assembly protein TadG